MANVRINYIVDKSQVEAADDALRDLNRTEGITEKSTQKLSNKFRDVNTDANRAKRGVNDVGNELKKFNNLASNAGKLLAGLFAVNQLVSFGKSIVETTGKFQTFEAVLTNTLGSNSKARKAIDEISKFAAQTPFSVDQLTASFVKLANQGFVPTTGELRKLGDLSASVGKDFDQLTEALIDAQVGEFERLKEFGIRASKEGDQVRFTFKGIETQTDFTNEAIRDYILSLGDLQGVSGSIAAISATVTGKVSNLGDNFTQLQNNIGSANSGLISGILDLANNALGALNEELAKSNKIAQILEAREIIKPGFWDTFADAIFNGGKGLKEYNDQVEATDFFLDAAERQFESFTKSIEGLGNSEAIEKVDEALTKTFGNTFLEERLKGLREELVAGSTEIQDYIKKWEDLTKEQKKTFIETGELNLKLKETQKTFEEFTTEIAKGFSTAAFKTNEVTDEIFKLGSEFTKEQKAKAAELNSVLDFILSEGEKQNEAYYESAKHMVNEWTDHYKKESKKRKKTDEDEADSKKKLIDESIKLALSAADSLTGIQQNRLQKEINQLEQQKQYELNLEGRTEEEKASIESRFDAQILAKRQEQARREKALAIFNIAVNTAQAIIAALAPPPNGLGPVAGIPFSIAAGVAGALQAGVVASTPLPFNKGTKRVPGYGDVDSVPAILTPGEKVFDKGTSKAYGPVLDAIFDHKIRPEVLNSFIRNGGSQVVVNNDMTAVARALKSQPKRLINFDQHGFSVHQITESQKIIKKMNRYKG